MTNKNEPTPTLTQIGVAFAITVFFFYLIWQAIEALFFEAILPTISVEWLKTTIGIIYVLVVCSFVPSAWLTTRILAKKMANAQKEDEEERES